MTAPTIRQSEKQGVVTLPTQPGRLSGQDGPPVAFDTRGEGAPTVQLHGLTSSRRRDEILGLDLTKGCQQLRVRRYDARGHGHTPGTTDPRDYTWPSLANDLLAVVDEFSPREPVHGVGQSMGAATLITAAVARPERFASLTLAIPPTAWECRVAQAEIYEESAEICATLGAAGFAEATRRPHPSPAISPDRPFTLPDVADGWLPATFTGARASDLPPRDEVAELSCPILLLSWPEDPSHPLEIAEELSEMLPNAVLRVATTPDDVAGWPAQVEDFISGLGK